MNGSEKQIKWAADIKRQMGLEQLVGQFNEVADRALNYIKEIDSAVFWIDYRELNANQLMQALVTTGLSIKGHGNSHLAKMAPDGTITITWTEIVQDGKGGHKITRRETL